jgi:TolB-like protein
MVLTVTFSSPVVSEPSGDSVVVAVLYFDDNTGDAAFGPLRKGLADMMITDLSAVPGVRVVEREKLQQLLMELKLQQSTFFEKATAQRIGKGIGARYVVTGAIAKWDPEIRLDLRMIEVASGKVVLAEKVVGQMSIFALQQELVRRFLAGLRLRTTPPALTSRVPDTARLLVFSRGLDLVDRGELEAASKTLAMITSGAPEFKLARDREVEILARLRAARGLRDMAIAADRRTLFDNAERYLSSHDMKKLDAAEAEFYLGYRLLEMARTYATLTVLAPVIPVNRRVEGQKVMSMLFSQGLTFIRDFERARAMFSEHRLFGPRLPSEDEKRTKTLDVQLPRFGHFGKVHELKQELAEFVLRGTFEVMGKSGGFRPSLALLDPSSAANGQALFEEAIRDVEEYPEVLQEFLDKYAEALLWLGKNERAIAQWQLILDRFPTGKMFLRAEQRIQETLDSSRMGYMKDQADLEEALAHCDAGNKSDPQRAFKAFGRQTVKRGGTIALSWLVSALVQRCGEKVALERGIFAIAAVLAQEAGDCDYFDTLFEKLPRAQFFHGYGAVCPHDIEHPDICAFFYPHRCIERRLKEHR